MELTRIPTSKEDFRAKMLSAMPESARAAATRNFTEWDALTPEEQKARMPAIGTVRLDMLTVRRNACGLEGKQWSNTFARYKPQSQSQRDAKDWAMGFADSLPEVECGAMLYGPCGRGKDHLLHAIVIRAFERELTLDIRYYYGLDIERAMILEWDTYNHSKPDDDTRTEERMRGCDLLLIGDLHKLMHVKSPQVINAVQRTINQCETTGKPILCVTSNQPPSYYDKLSDSLGSRLSTCCLRLHVDSPEDWRRAGKR